MHGMSVLEPRGRGAFVDDFRGHHEEVVRHAFFRVLSERRAGRLRRECGFHDDAHSAISTVALRAIGPAEVLRPQVLRVIRAWATGGEAGVWLCSVQSCWRRKRIHPTIRQHTQKAARASTAPSELKTIAITVLASIEVLMLEKPVVFVDIKPGAELFAQISNPEYTIEESELHAMAVPASTDTLFGP